MPNSGLLSVRVFTSAAQLPIAGATVAVTRQLPGGARQLIALRITDADGRIDPIPILTPDADRSQSPGAEQPFALCDITASDPRYELLTVYDAQIFAGVTSLQPMQLIPLPEDPEVYGGPNQYTVFPDQEL